MMTPLSGWHIAYHLIVDSIVTTKLFVRLNWDWLSTFLHDFFVGFRDLFFVLLSCFPSFLFVSSL